MHEPIQSVFKSDAFRALVFLPAWLAYQTAAWADCTVAIGTPSATRPQDDVLLTVFEGVPSCPSNISELRSQLEANGVALDASMVANRGRNNPARGSFSFFEYAGSELFLGHFTTLTPDGVDLDQTPARGALLIELMAWDKAKGLYNFYELIGNGLGSSPTWFYRGDSSDALRDTATVSLNEPATFGSAMRCSGCHSQGGPIMKELAAPYDSWWTPERPLLFPDQGLSPGARLVFEQVKDASQLSLNVRQGTDRLLASTGYQMARREVAASAAGLGLRNVLKPLFCTTEINLVSSEVTWEAALSGAAPDVSLPQAALSWWGASAAQLALVGGVGSELPTVSLPASVYRDLVVKNRLNFPETSLADADHAWLAPAQSQVDSALVAQLVSAGTIDFEFAIDVLALNTALPFASAGSCALLGLVPEGVTSEFSAWKDEFVAQLAQSSESSAALLLSHLTDPEKNARSHIENETQRLISLDQVLRSGSPRGDMMAASLFDELLLARSTVRRLPLSQNPRGQILEPGFRVIFPVPQNGP